MKNIEILKYLRLPSIRGLRLGKEDKLSYELAVFLRQAYIEGKLKAVFTHIANESKSSIKAGQLRKCIGMLPGAADWIIASGEIAVFIELKAPKSYQRPTQKLFEKMCTHAGVHYYVCRSVKEVQAVLIKHNIYKPLTLV